jgi:hypothetical protein
MKHLVGDLNQMANQMAELKMRGINAKVDGGIPSIQDSEYQRALLIIWTNGIAGWWNYKDDFLEYDICTEEQFMNKLRS